MTLLASVMFFTPASAGRIPFFSRNKTPSPAQYSQKEDQINSYNEQAIELFEEGRFKEAQELWEKAIEIMERSKKYPEEYQELIDELEPGDAVLINIEKDEKPQSNEAEDLYQAAVNFFKKQKYIAAKKLFDQVESKIPDYKATRNYLTILSHKLKAAQQSLGGQKLNRSAHHRHAEREEWKRILRESEQELEEKLIEQVTPLYKEAIQLYKARKFSLAKDYFLEIDSIMPEYIDTSKYLVRINADIEKEEQRLAQEANRKKVLARKKEQEEWKQIIAESERQLKETLKLQAEPIYQEALYYYKKREFELARSSFIEVEQVHPNYKSVAKYH